MIRSLLWKDTREHLATLLTLCFGGIGLMVGVGALMAFEPGNTPMRTGQATGICILLLAPGIALLLGSLFLGSDKENGVSAWLDSLPEPFWKIWLARNVFAILSQFALVGSWGVFWLLVYAPKENLLEPAMVVFLLVVSLMGTGWGQWGVHRSRTVFGGFGNGLLGLIAAVISILVLDMFLAFLVDLIAKTFRAERALSVAMSNFYLIFGLALSIVLPLFWVFIEISRQFGIPKITKNSLVKVALRLVWLSGQAQSRPLLIMTAIGLVLGFMLPESFLVWPIWSISIGVVSGLCVLAKDQNGPGQLHGSMRAFQPFLLDLRAIPAFLLGLVVNIVPILPLGIAATYRGIFYQGPDQQVLEIFWPGIGHYIPVAPYVCLWFCAGFGTALWCSFFLENSVVAFVVSWGLGALVSLVWIPALLGGGLSLLWVLGLVAVYWGLGRYLYRGFVSQNLSKAGPASFGLLVVCVGIFCGLGILNRLYPARGQAEDPFSMDEISRAIKNENPKLEDEVRRHLVDNRRGIGPSAQFQFLPESTETLLNMPVSGWPEKVIRYLKEVAPKNPGELAGEWKVPDELFTFFGAKQSDQVVSEPQVWLYQAQNINMQMQSRGISALWEVSRGTKGSEEKFSNEIERILYLGECLRNKSHEPDFNNGDLLERFGYQMIDYHLMHNKPTEAGLAALAGVLEKAGARIKKVKPMTREIGFWISRKSNENKSIWRKIYSFGPHIAEKPWIAAYWQMVDLALSAPWEMERSRKLINYWFSANPPTDRFGWQEQYDYDLDQIPFWHLNTWNSMSPNKFLSIEQRSQVIETINDLAKTAIALKRFRIAKGSWPKTLSELAPAYLKEVSKDPYTQTDFGFLIFEGAKSSGSETPGTPGSDGPSGLGGEGSPTPGMSEGGSMSTGEFSDGSLLPSSGDKQFAFVPGTFILWSVGPHRAEYGGLVNDPFGQLSSRSRHSSLVFVIAP